MKAQSRASLGSEMVGFNFKMVVHQTLDHKVLGSILTRGAVLCP